MTEARDTINDVLSSFTGWDEIAISSQFGHDWTDLTGMSLARAAWFVQARRRGVADGDAYREAMGVTVGALKDAFADDDADVDARDAAVAAAVASGDIAALASAAAHPEA